MLLKKDRDRRDHCDGEGAPKDLIRSDVTQILVTFSINIGRGGEELFFLPQKFPAL